VKKFTFLAFLVALAWASPGFGQGEETKALKDRIKSVTGRSYLKSGRLELTLLPMTSISLNDAFYQKLGGGLSFGYHFSDAFALHLIVTYSLNLGTSNATYHPTSGEGEASIPYAGKRNILASVDFSWAPVYGKISVAGEWILHFDTYLLAGLGMIGGDIQKDVASTKTSLNPGFGADFGLGFRLFFNRTFALRAELRDYMIFSDKVSVNGKARSDVQNQLLFNLGLSIFFLDGDAEE